MHQTKQFLETFAMDTEMADTDAPSGLLGRVGSNTIAPSSVKPHRLATTVDQRHTSIRSQLDRLANSSIGGASRMLAPLVRPSDGNVMDPLRMLHKCIRYFASHPEIYGTNLNALLDRELMYVMRVKASEAALLAPGMVPVFASSLPAINTSKTKGAKLRHPALEKCAGWMVTPRSIEAAVSAGTVVRGGGMFGFGATSFVEGTPGFFSLLDKASRRVELHEERVPAEVSEIEGGSSCHTSSATDFSHLERSVSSQEKPLQQDAARVRFISSSEEFPLSSVSGRPQADAGPMLLVDGTSYEVSFLRSQLQQVEAAYNAKCILHHELQQENTQLKSQLNVIEKKMQQYQSRNQEMRVQMESMKRELDAWKQRASELNISGQNDNPQSSSESSRRMQSMQLGQAKRELLHMSRLWRETEKSLQETKRALESAENEAQLSHSYLEDAFYLIERLERRIVRRDHYIEIQGRRQASSEEKCEKLMWCLEELRTINGGSSYVDYLLSQDDVWSLFLFVRLQRRFMGYAQVEETVPVNVEPLFFQRTPLGGQFVDMYSPSLLLRLVTDSGLGKTGNMNKVSTVKLRTHLPRWRAMYTIDFMPINGVESSDINTAEGTVTRIGNSRRSFPVLSLTSLLLPQQNSTLMGGFHEDEKVPNTAHYDKATLRLVLYSFWSERLLQYKKEMERRLRELKASRHVLTGPLPEEAGTTDDDEVESTSFYPATFLAALVDFVHRTYPPSTTPADTSMDKPKRIVVRGQAGRSERALDGGHFLFASIISIQSDGTEVPLILSTQARELLFALYYYAEEYKEVDADFRLFYLTAHQQIPEIVGVNFWASLEALRKDFENALCRHLGFQSLDESELGITTDHDAMPQEKVVEHKIIDETPFHALNKAVNIIDTAPLVEQSTCMEPDSDEEGYGLILAGNQTNNGPLGSQQGRVDEPKKVDSNTLKHNIRDYLFPPPEEESASPTTPAKSVMKDSSVTDTDACTTKKGEIPAAWVTLDERLGAILGPHASLLKAFRANKGPDISKEQRCRRQRFKKEIVSNSASRGLLPFDEVLELMYKHCFATYAVSCCGGARFSLVEALTQSGDSDIVDGILNSPEHLTKVGWLPPSETQMRRLRFAIGMDQPSPLLRFTDFFDVDSRHGVPTHFHDEYLQITLDTYMQHQEAWMNTLLRYVVSSDDAESLRGIDESDTTVPFPLIRNGVLRVFRQILQSPEQGNTLAKHFLNYCNLLRDEEDICLEQFTDAPIFINSRSLSQSECDVKFNRNQKRRWPVEEESASCSLLHLSLAVRMTYIIWGSYSLPSARLAGLVLSSTSSDELRSMELFGERETLSADMQDDAFLARVEQEFLDAVYRVKTGVMRHNALRRLAVELKQKMDGTEANFAPLVLTELYKKTLSSADILGTSLNIRRLYAPWDDERSSIPQTRGSTARGRGRSRASRRTTSTILTSDSMYKKHVAEVYIPEVASLARFLRIGHVNKGRHEKKKKVKQTKGFQEPQPILLAMCASYETTYIKYQKHLVKLLVEAAKMPEAHCTDSIEDAETEIQLEVNGEVGRTLSNFAPVGIFSRSIDSSVLDPAQGVGEERDNLVGLPNVFGESGDTHVKKQAMPQERKYVVDGLVSVRQVHAGCAALSLM
ncbi:hypothetical protein TraAM80_01699 [Trypanosoma rangeli]|uniref:Uncharacterized protein n=1 Tax=Trypanosoma rangeli TaxID=5698 RepID=A0A3R7MS26_TRYRA|nr:uncharacterized protein TraAM80_01699 [Trypanosoma rangeli]RNF10339.1 hypothetical protein TraAM80_01699 [Trypanosoma rangeli]|eukprot:RNF10339.1 hypothetical protein TraAM80_01699 [Trypanosoma rangeli]